jgi:small subunit ribosomal protein S1
VLGGTVTKVVAFGAFVEILPGVEGLVHISELADHHVESPSEVVEPGAALDVKILEIDEERRRLSLSIKQVEEQKMPMGDLSAQIQEAAEGSTEVASDDNVEEPAAEAEVAEESVAQEAEPVAAEEAPAPEVEEPAAEEAPAEVAEEPVAEEAPAEVAEEPVAEEPEAEASAEEPAAEPEAPAEEPVVEAPTEDSSES